MSTIFIQDGASIDYIPPTDTPAGTVVLQGELVGVVRVAIKANKLGALAVEGIFDFPTEDPGAWSVGQFAYWRDGGETAFPDGDGAKLIGKVIMVDPRPGTNYVRVRMSQ